MPSMPVLERDQALAKPAYRILAEAFGAKVFRVTDYRGDLAITVDRSAWKEAARTLRDHPELDYKLFLDLCGVDFLNDESRPDRFEVALHLYSVSHKHHIRLKTSLSEKNPVCETLTDVYKGANWFEREAFDLYGIAFTGHPNLTRILTHEDFVGHPMRKDFATGKRFVNKKPKEWLLTVPKGSEHLVLNVGPSHPAMHGTFRVQVLLDG